MPDEDLEGHRRVEEGIRGFVALMTDYPKEVEVVATPGEATMVMILIRVNQRDLGRVIGKKGKWREALQKLIEKPISGARGHRYRLDGIIALS